MPLSQRTFPRPRSRVALLAITLIALVASISVIVLATRGPDPTDPTTAVPACREEVRAKMRAPATTQFSGGETVIDANSRRPQIDGTYDSQNGFGALERGTYSCVLNRDDAGRLTVSSVMVNE